MHGIPFYDYCETPFVASTLCFVAGSTLSRFDCLAETGGSKSSTIRNNYHDLVNCISKLSRVLESRAVPS